MPQVIRKESYSNLNKRRLGETGHRTIYNNGLVKIVYNKYRQDHTTFNLIKYKLKYDGKEQKVEGLRTDRSVLKIFESPEKRKPIIIFQRDTDKSITKIRHEVLYHLVKTIEL